MTHDQMCPSILDASLPDKFGMMEKATCRCDLIAKVRADELHQIRDTVQQAAQEAAFTPSMDGLFDAVELIDSAIKDLGGGNEPAVA